MERIPVFCGRDCGGDACPLLAEMKNGRVVSIHHNPAAGSHIRGCAKGYRLPEFHYSEERIKKPLIRVGPRGSKNFRVASWDESMSLVINMLTSSIERFGFHSIMDGSSAGSTGALHNTGTLTSRFLNLIGGCTFLDGSYSSNAAKYALSKVFGKDFRSSGFDAKDVLDAGCIVLMGANALEARLGSELTSRLLQAKKLGIPIIGIDPRKTGTIKALDAVWLPIVPSTDSALLYSIIYMLDKSRVVSDAYLEQRAIGYEEILAHVRGEDDGIAKTPEWASAICGISVKDIHNLGDLWKSGKPILLIPGYSIQRTYFGEEAMRLTVLVQLMSGNFGRAGASAGSLNNRNPQPRIETLDTGSNDNNLHIPISIWPDAILDGAGPDHEKIHVAFFAGSNLLNQGGDITKNIRAINTLDFVVSNEMFLTPTARYSDVIFPVASPLQKEDIGIPWDGNYLLYKPKILPYTGQERSDYEIFSELSYRMGKGSAYSLDRTESQWIDAFLNNSEVKDIDSFKATGFYSGSMQEKRNYVLFSIDPIVHPMGTASGKLEFGGYSCKRWKNPSLGFKGKRKPLSLITPKKKDRVHSQGGDLGEKIFENELLINPESAMEWGFLDNQVAIIRSIYGTARAKLKYSHEIRPGVVSLYEGSWYEDSKGSNSPNLLTPSIGTEESQSCIMHGIPVCLEVPES